MYRAKAERARRLRALRRGHARPRQRAPAGRERPAPRARGRRRADRPLPADRHARRRRGHRGRGARALEPPRARARRPRRVHPRRRGERRDPRHRRARCCASPAPRRRSWNARGGRPLSVSVNLSPRQVASPGIAAMVATVLAETGLDPALLTLEITEGVLVTESEATAQTLIDLKALGLRLVLDDFGTGYSSLAYLRRFPIDGLKIDRRFIAAMDTSTPGQDDRRGDHQDGRGPADRRRGRGRGDDRAGGGPRAPRLRPRPGLLLRAADALRPTWRRCSTTACPTTSARRGLAGPPLLRTP